MLACSRCKQPKQETDFWVGKNGRLRICKTCSLEKNKKYRDTHRESLKSKRANYNKNNVAIIRDQAKTIGRRCYEKKILKSLELQESYSAILERVGGKCQLSGEHETSLSKNGHIRNLAIDHCHRCGKFRGLIRNKYNRGLGYFDDDPILLAKSIIYLSQHRDDKIDILNKVVLLLKENI